MSNVLVTPLDWGLGHASRCIPVIRELLSRNCKVFIAGSGDSLELLKREFPSLNFFSLPSYRPIYSTSLSMVWKMAVQIPKFLSTIRNEHTRTQELIRELHINFIISDNRYGCWSASVPSVIITHQLNILMPQGLRWFGRLVKRVNHSLLRKFSYCWIPDYPDGRSLAGKLRMLGNVSRSLPVKYLGILSRFAASEISDPQYDLLCILSGPEPQRSLFEKKIVEQVPRSGLKCFIVRGLVGNHAPLPLGIEHAHFLNSDELQTLIARSSSVLARSGYSTVMDLARLGKKAIFVPTPGQTEQEYLATRFKSKGIAYSMEQENFDLSMAWKKSNAYSGFNVFAVDTNLLTDALDDLMTARFVTDEKNHAHL